MRPWYRFAGSERHSTSGARVDRREEKERGRGLARAPYLRGGLLCLADEALVGRGRGASERA